MLPAVPIQASIPTGHSHDNPPQAPATEMAPQVLLPQSRTLVDSQLAPVSSMRVTMCRLKLPLGGLRWFWDGFWLFEMWKGKVVGDRLIGSSVDGKVGMGKREEEKGSACVVVGLGERSNLMWKLFGSRE